MVVSPSGLIVSAGTSYWYSICDPFMLSHLTRIYAKLTCERSYVVESNRVYANTDRGLGLALPHLTALPSSASRLRTPQQIVVAQFSHTNHYSGTYPGSSQVCVCFHQKSSCLCRFVGTSPPHNSTSLFPMHGNHSQLLYLYVIIFGHQHMLITDMHVRRIQCVRRIQVDFTFECVQRQGHTPVDLNCRKDTPAKI